MANQLSLGSWITLGHPAIAEIYANAGFGWLVIDLEHSTISIDQAGELICTMMGKLEILCSKRLKKVYWIFVNIL